MLYSVSATVSLYVFIHCIIIIIIMLLIYIILAGAPACSWFICLLCFVCTCLNVAEMTSGFLLGFWQLLERVFASLHGYPVAFSSNVPFHKAMHTLHSAIVSECNADSLLQLLYIIIIIYIYVCVCVCVWWCCTCMCVCMCACMCVCGVGGHARCSADVLYFNP